MAQASSLWAFIDKIHRQDAGATQKDMVVRLSFMKARLGYPRTKP